MPLNKSVGVIFDLLFVITIPTYTKMNIKISHIDIFSIIIEYMDYFFFLNNNKRNHFFKNINTSRYLPILSCYNYCSHKTTAIGH